MSQNFKLSMTAEEINQSLQSMHSLLNEQPIGLVVSQVPAGSVGGDYEYYYVYNVNEEGNIDVESAVGIRVNPETKIPDRILTYNKTLPILWYGESV